MNIEAAEKVVQAKRDALARLKKEVDLREGKLRMARAKAADKAEANKNKVKTVPSGTLVSKIHEGGISLTDDVLLHGYIYGPREGDNGECRGRCYEHHKMTGDPEVDRWRGGQHDHTGPTFIQRKAASQWNRLAKKMNALIKKYEVYPERNCGCK